MTGCSFKLLQMPHESLTNSSMDAPVLEQEGGSHPLTPEHREPVHPHCFTSPRMKKLAGFSKTARHASLPVKGKPRLLLTAKKSHLFLSSRGLSRHGNRYSSLLCFWAGERMGGCGLREDGGPADHDRAGPPVPEPLPVIWFHLKSPRPLTPSRRRLRRPPTGSRKRQSSEDKFYFL